MAVKTQIGFLAAGISAFIILTLLLYCLGTLQQAKNCNEGILYFLTWFGGVYPVGGKRNLPDSWLIHHTDFSISTIQILGTAFFVILVHKKEPRDKQRAIPAVIIALLYFFCVGKAHLIPLAYKPYITGLMVILSVVGVVQTIMETPQKKAFEGKANCRLSPLCWFVFTLILSLPALYFSRKMLSFIGTGFLSSVMSFGGGDAYLSVAQGLFVDSGIISYHDFYGNIVSMATPYRAPFFVEVFLSGCAYMLGYNLNGSVFQGLCTALCGFACSVAAWRYREYYPRSL